MGTRIRYRKDPEGYLSMQVFKTADGREVLGYLSTSQLEGAVVDATTRQVIGATVTAGYSHLTKKLVKKRMEELGVTFGREVRGGLPKDNPEQS